MTLLPCRGAVPRPRARARALSFAGSGPLGLACCKTRNGLRGCAPPAAPRSMTTPGLNSNARHLLLRAFALIWAAALAALAAAASASPVAAPLALPPGGGERHTHPAAAAYLVHHPPHPPAHREARSRRHDVLFSAVSSDKPREVRAGMAVALAAFLPDAKGALGTIDTSPRRAAATRAAAVAAGERRARSVANQTVPLPLPPTTPAPKVS